jgi:AcrR family transcriptional regulator
MPKVKLGRPRSLMGRQKILHAAFALMSERGYEGLTFEAIAQASGSAKTTIYRWWPTKAQLAVEAFFETTREALALPDTGDAATDFRQQITDLADLLRDDKGRVFASMLGGARNDLVLAQALGEKWLQPRRIWGQMRLQKAMDLKLCRDGVDLDAALGLLYGPVYTPLLFGQIVPSAARIQAHLDLALFAVFK